MKPKDTPISLGLAGHRHGRVPKAIREQQLLDIADRQFSELGYDGTTVESVRLEAGVSRPIIYDHFGSKDHLYVACVKRARQQYEMQIEELWTSEESQQLTLSEMITRASTIYFSIVEANPKRWLILFGSSSVPMFGQMGEELGKARKGTIDQIIRLISTQTPDADLERVEAFAHAIFALGEHLGRWWMQHPEIPKSRVISHHVAFITGGLGNVHDDAPKRLSLQMRMKHP